MIAWEFIPRASPDTVPLKGYTSCAPTVAQPAQAGFVNVAREFIPRVIPRPAPDFVNVTWEFIPRASPGIAGRRTDQGVHGVRPGHLARHRAGRYVSLSECFL